MNERELLTLIISSSPKISVSDIEPDGNVVFTVLVKDLGIREADLDAPIAGTAFFSCFVGELLVRRNLKDFVAILENLDAASYDRLVNSYQHKCFGMCGEKGEGGDRLKFTFHISLVVDIITEDLIPVFCH